MPGASCAMASLALPGRGIRGAATRSLVMPGLAHGVLTACSSRPAQKGPCKSTGVEPWEDRGEGSLLLLLGGFVIRLLEQLSGPSPGMTMECAAPSVIPCPGSARGAIEPAPAGVSRRAVTAEPDSRGLGPGMTTWNGGTCGPSVANAESPRAGSTAPVRAGRSRRSSCLRRGCAGKRRRRRRGRRPCGRRCCMASSRAGRRSGRHRHRTCRSPRARR